MPHKAQRVTLGLSSDERSAITARIIQPAVRLVQTSNILRPSVALLAIKHCAFLGDFPLDSCRLLVNAATKIEANHRILYHQIVDFRRLCLIL
jgi:hypothetical protein